MKLARLVRERERRILREKRAREAALHAPQGPQWVSMPSEQTHVQLALRVFEVFRRKSATRAKCTKSCVTSGRPCRVTITA